MSGNYAIILSGCEPASIDAVAAAVGKLFGIKESTSKTVVESTPIVLVEGLNRDEAAAMHLTMYAIAACGGNLDVDEVGDDLPKIDWPKRPLIARREIADITAEFRAYTLATTNGDMSLLDVLNSNLNVLMGGAPSAGIDMRTPSPFESGGRQEFREAALGEITPFSNPVLPTIPSGEPGSGVHSRLDEVFPEEDDELVPNSSDITSILDRLLPDEDGGVAASTAASNRMTAAASSAAVPTVGSAPLAAAGGGSGGFSVFLAKIADEGRRTKAVPLLAEMVGIEAGEAEVLAKKVIIPVLKGVSKEEAEAAKQRFAEIGVLARIKAS